ncbi:hypothetical protein RZS08_29535, partial [Arthrospira platensis SPKY1]|nr:hypothetical protein [Arthrospira platensis SPKY1]
MPDHLGWISARVTAVLRTTQKRHAPQERHAPQPEPPSRLPRFTPAPAQTRGETTGSPPAVVKLHPSVALGMLRAGQAAAGRLWLLLRCLDTQGRGWVELETARQ